MFEFSLSSFTFIKRLFSSSSLSVIRVVSSAYLRLLTFLPAILIPACASSSPEFLMMYSACKVNKQGDSTQPWCAPFPILNQSVFPCPVLTALLELLQLVLQVILCTCPLRGSRRSWARALSQALCLALKGMRLNSSPQMARGTCWVCSTCIEELLSSSLGLQLLAWCLEREFLNSYWTRTCKSLATLPGASASGFYPPVHCVHITRRLFSRQNTIMSVPPFIHRLWAGAHSLPDTHILLCFSHS